ncbi:hypothetical protein [Nonomuraea maritima]|uniref:hypothetical protein n=1 Tax=Nonomuraea maritima TaxID=683260 RepID=UPI00371857AA
MLLVTACSVPLPAPSTNPHVLVYSTPVRTSPARPLVDLRTKVDGKVLLHHVADSGDEISWTGTVKVKGPYKVTVDCVGAQGMLMVAPHKGWKAVRQCGVKYGTYTVGGDPGSKPTVATLMIEAPQHAGWAVLVTRAR